MTHSRVAEDGRVLTADDLSRLVLVAVEDEVLVEGRVENDGLVDLEVVGRVVARKDVVLRDLISSTFRESRGPTHRQEVLNGSGVAGVEVLRRLGESLQARKIRVELEIKWKSERTSSLGAMRVKFCDSWPRRPVTAWAISGLPSIRSARATA